MKEHCVSHIELFVFFFGDRFSYFPFFSTKTTAQYVSRHALPHTHIRCFSREWHLKQAAYTAYDIEWFVVSLVSVCVALMSAC